MITINLRCLCLETVLSILNNTDRHRRHRRRRLHRGSQRHLSIN